MPEKVTKAYLENIIQKKLENEFEALKSPPDKIGEILNGTFKQILDSVVDVKGEGEDFFRGYLQGVSNSLTILGQFGFLQGIEGSMLKQSLTELIKYIVPKVQAVQNPVANSTPAFTFSAPEPKRGS